MLLQQLMTFPHHVRQQWTVNFFYCKILSIDNHVHLVEIIALNIYRCDVTNKVEVYDLFIAIIIKYATRAVHHVLRLTMQPSACPVLVMLHC